ncbi:MAG: sugar transferase [Myxococcales bacterium]|nr:sugar transferase [Myxococcales bacterium]
MIDLLLVLLSLRGGEFLRTCVTLGMPLDIGAGPITWLTPRIYLAALFSWLVAFLITGPHEARALPARRTCRRLATANLLGLLAFLSVLFFLKVTDFSRGLVAYTFCLSLVLLMLRQLLTAAFLDKLLRPFAQRILIVGEGEMGSQLADQIYAHPWGMQLVGALTPNNVDLDDLPTLGKLTDLPNVVRAHRIDQVLIALPAKRHQLIGELVLRLQTLPVRIHVIPDLLGLTMSHACVEDFFGIPLIGLREPPIGSLGRLYKRLFDIASSALALLVTSPVMLACMLAIRLYDGGPVFFRQKRIGENGRPFDMFKFRSMVVDAESRLKSLGIDRDRLDSEDAAFKLKNDPRITPVGRFLRRWSLDELPQLFNVLRGDMSLVGPRPEEAKVVARYSFFHRKRLALKPGLTGPMQVNGRGDLPLKKRLSLELAYIDQWCFWTDIKILFRTIPAVISGRGAY